MRIFVSRNIFHVNLNIMIWTSKIRRQQKRTFEQIHSKLYEMKTLTSTFNKNVAELLNYMYHLWSHVSGPTTGTHGSLRVQIIIQNNRNIHGEDQWTYNY